MPGRNPATENEMSTLTARDVSVEGQQDHGDVFPRVIAMTSEDTTLDEVRTWIGQHRDALLESLSQHGAILFRGFPVDSALDFDAFIRAFGLASFTYEESLSNAVRVNKTELVFTANEAPADVSIFLHHEMAQTPLYPSKLFFCCEKAPGAAGETPLCRSDVLLERLQEVDAGFVDACMRLGVRYSNVMPGSEDMKSGQGRSWKSTLHVESQDAAEERLTSLGYDFEWQADGGLRATTPVMPAIRTLVDGRRVFFNQLIAAFRGWKERGKSIRFGDDSPIPAESMETTCRLADELSFDLAWQKGDVALLDNFLVMHGRRPFRGERRVLASLVADDGSRLAA